MRFKRWSYTSDLAPSAVLDLDDPCGIYVLEFANGDQYVGQARNVAKRLAAHRRRWADIVAVEFTPVAQEGLDEIERAMIQDRQARNIPVRNKAGVTLGVGASVLDRHVDEQEQQEWLQADVSQDEVLIGDRASTAARRARSQTKFAELTRHPLYGDVLDSLAAYVGLVIPRPHLTEGRSWTMTALPSTNRSRVHRRLVTLSVNNVELLYIGEDLVDDIWRPWTALNTALSPAPPAGWEEVMDIGNYRSTGDVAHWEVDGLPLRELLAEPDILRAARRLAVGQLRKGRTMFTRYHNDHLADAVFLRIEQTAAANGDMT